MAYTNLLAKIESELNSIVLKMQSTPRFISTGVNNEYVELEHKKNRLEKLAFDYVNLEGRYKELAGFNSVY